MRQTTTPQQQTEHLRQRVRVGMIGLAGVMLLIGLASAIFSTVNRDQPVRAAGAARPEVVANMVDTAPTVAAGSEPLAEIGVTPSTGNTAAPASTRPTAR